MMCHVHYGCLNGWTCCCSWTLLKFYVCLLWIPQQIDMLLHMDIVIIYVCSLWIIQQKDLLLHMDTVVMLYVTDLLWRQQSEL